MISDQANRQMPSTSGDIVCLWPTYVSPVMSSDHSADRIIQRTPKANQFLPILIFQMVVIAVITITVAKRTHDRMVVKF